MGYPLSTGVGINDTNEVQLLRWLVILLGGNVGSGGGAGGGIITVPVTPVSALKTAGQSGTIPSGAKGWTFTVLTGTATFNGAAVPAGFSDSDVNTTAAAINYTMDSPGTAYVRYNT